MAKNRVTLKVVVVEALIVVSLIVGLWYFLGAEVGR
jgi:hypothetical protein